MEYQANPQPDRPPPPPAEERRSRPWWKDPRWLILIAVVVLALVVIGAVVALTTGTETASDAAAGTETPSAAPTAVDTETPSAAPTAVDAERPSAAPTAGAEGEAAALPSPSPDPGGATAQDQTTAQVCDRIMAFQEDVRSGQMNPLAAFSEMNAIEREARGTRLADETSAAARVMQDVVAGRASVDDVVAAGTRLAAAC
jgi:hypothetical protein